MFHMSKILCSIALAITTTTSGCSQLKQQIKIPRSSEAVIELAEQSIPIVAANSNLVCLRLPERKACMARVAKDQEIANYILGIVKKWLPRLLAAVDNGDAAGESDALEHLATALKLAPEAYSDVIEMGKKLLMLKQ